MSATEIIPDEQLEQPEETKRASMLRKIASNTARLSKNSARVAAIGAIATPKLFVSTLIESLSNPKLRIIILATIISSFSLIGLSWYVANRLANPPTIAPLGFNLSDALLALDKGNFIQARNMLEQLELSGAFEDENQGAPDYIRGMILSNEADRMWDLDQVRFARQAARHLQSASELGWPAGHEAEGAAALCKNLINSGQYVAARPLIDPAIDSHPDQATELHRLATIAWLSEPDSDLDKALKHNSAYLADKTLHVTLQQSGLLQQAKIYFRKHENEKCHEIIRNLRNDTDAILDGLLLEAELSLRESRKILAGDGDESTKRAQANSILRNTLETLKKAEERGRARERVLRTALYLRGICLIGLNRNTEASKTLQTLRSTYPNTPEGLLASLEEAELHERNGRTGEILPILTSAIRSVGSAADYSNPLLSLSQLQEKLIGFYHVLMDQHQFASAVTLANELAAILSPERSTEFAAQANVEWARYLELKMQSDNNHNDVESQELQRTIYRAAGNDYAKLAQLKFATPQYSDFVWKSAENARLGRDYPTAITMLKEYLNYELKDRRPIALMNLGECQLQMGKLSEALVTLQDCIITYPNDVSSSRARVLTAKAWSDKGELAKAKELLLTNIESPQLTPASTEWRDSLFALGILNHREAQLLVSTLKIELDSSGLLKSKELHLKSQELHQESIRLLEEAVGRYPNSGQAIMSRYLIAESYRALSEYPKLRLSSASIQTARDQYTKEIREFLNSAIQEYQTVQNALVNRREDEPLTPMELSLLKNCLFAMGSCWMEIEHYEDAILAFTILVNRFQGSPEVLQGLTRIADCQQKLGRAEESSTTLEQARIYLDQLKKSSQVPLQDRTNHSSEEWNQIWDWMKKNAEAVPR